MKRDLVLLLLPCLLAACGAPRRAEAPIQDHALSAELKRQAEAPYPESFRAQHRVTLTFRGRQIDFTGYLLVRRPGAWRAVAFGEFGGSLFDIAAFPGRSLRIVRNPGEIDEKWLTGPAAEIVRLLYLAEGGEPLSVSGNENAIGLSYGRGGTVYEFTYTDFAEFSGVARKLPRHIAAENRKMKLRLEIDLVKIEPMELPDRYFDHD